MLLERAAGLADKINRYEKLRASAAEAEQFRTRAVQLSRAASALSEARSTVDSLQQAGIIVSFVPANADGLVEKSKMLVALAAEDPAQLADPPFNVRYELTDRIAGIATGAQNAAIEAWQRHVASSAPPGSEDVLIALARLPQLRAGVARIRRCQEEFARLAGSLPANPRSAVERLGLLVAEQRAAWADLAADEIPRAVIHFIRSCAAEGGAEFGLLTDEVRAWLASRDLLRAFRIRIG